MEKSLEPQAIQSDSGSTTKFIFYFCCIFFISTLIGYFLWLSTPSPSFSSKVSPEVITALTAESMVDVTIALQADQVETVDKTNLLALRQQVAAVQTAVLDDLSAIDYTVRTELNLVPLLALRVNESALATLDQHDLVARIDLDIGGQGALSSSVPLIDGDIMRTLYGFTGKDVYVAILDTGIDTDHADLGHNVYHQACFLDLAGATDGCPNGTARQFGPGAAEDNSTVSHGTGIAGVIASGGNISAPGLAPDVNIAAIKVMNNLVYYEYDSEIIAALEYVLTDLPEVQFINVSLGDGLLYTGACDTANASMIGMAAVVDALRARGTLTFASTGNNFQNDKITGPACLSNVIAVAHSNIDNVQVERIVGAANTNDQTDLLAPGEQILTTAKNDAQVTVSGSSIAVPHVIGCAALLVEAGITDVEEVLDLLKSSETRLLNFSSGLDFPRIDCDIRRLYVDQDAAGASTGLSWTDAYTNVQDALTSARTYSESIYTQILVAEGVYYPDVGIEQTADSPTATFSLSNKIHLFGGFSGLTTTFTSRDPDIYVTILSGDIDENDANTDGNFIAESIADLSGTNAHHVITSLLTGTGTLDGFVITAGQAMSSAVPHGHVGGGLWVSSTLNLTLNDVIFSGNQAEYGGGLYCQTPLIITNASFVGNQAAHGGGTYANCDLIVEKSTFSGNEAANSGGGILITNTHTVTLNNVVINGNVAMTEGAGLAVGVGQATLNHATIQGNRTDGRGGGIFAQTGMTVTLKNSIVWNNQDSAGSGTITATIAHIAASPIISSSLIQGSGGSASWDPRAGTDGGGNLDTDPLFLADIDPTTAPTTTVAVFLQAGSPVLDTADPTSCLATDIRGVLRPQFSGCGMGIFEIANYTDTISVTYQTTQALVTIPTAIYDQFQMETSDTPYGPYTISQTLNANTPIPLSTESIHYYRFIGLVNRLDGGEVVKTIGVFNFNFDLGN